MPLTSPSDTSRYKVDYLTVLTNDPAANTEISYTVPAGTTYELLGAFVTLVTDATVANRNVALQIDDGTNVIAFLPAGASQTASLTTKYTWGQGLLTLTAITNGALTAGLHERLTLQPGYKVTTVTANRAATDNYGAMTLLVARYLG